MEKQLISDSAVRAIQDSVKTVPIEVPSGQFTTRQVFRRPEEATAATVGLSTLGSVIDYLTSGLDELNPKNIAIHVASQDRVEVISQLYGEHRQRERLIVADYTAPEFRWNQFYGCEDFIIALQAMFLDELDRAAVLKVVGNIKEENVRNTADDGITQTVSARAGIVKIEELPVPNPVMLKPFRTFPEVSQPESPFVLRLRQNAQGQLPSCALFEADGGQWKLRAIENVARYFRVKLEELNDPLRNIPILA